MFSALHKKERDKRTSKYFEYTDIDTETLELLNKLYFKKEDIDKLPKKWCINSDREIAFIHSEHVASAIVRGNNNECCEKYLFVVNNGYGIISTYYPERCPDKMLSSEIKFEKAENAPDMSHREIEELLKEAIKVYWEGWSLDYAIDRKLREIKHLKNTSISILHGRFSNELREIVDSITEIDDMELKFRRICMRHFVGCNVEEQHYDGFYLHNNEKSFFVFDVILWMYLHKNTSMTKLQSDWEKITLCGIYYKLDLEKDFGIGGNRKFFFEDYFNSRKSKGKIIIENDMISFSHEHKKDILQKLTEPLGYTVWI